MWLKVYVSIIFYIVTFWKKIRTSLLPENLYSCFDVGISFGDCLLSEMNLHFFYMYTIFVLFHLILWDSCSNFPLVFRSFVKTIHVYCFPMFFQYKVVVPFLIGLYIYPFSLSIRCFIIYIYQSFVYFSTGQSTH